MGENTPLEVKPPLLWNPSERIPPNLEQVSAMELPTESENFIRTAHGIRLCGELMSPNLVKFTVSGLTLPALHRWCEI